MNKLQNCTALLSVIFLLFMLGSCENRRWDADTSDVKVDINIERFDKAMFSIDSGHFDEGMEQLLIEYPALTHLLIEQVIGFGRVENPRTMQLFRDRFLFDPYMRDSMYSVVRKIYTEKEIEKLEANFEDAFKRVQYFLQPDTLPRLSTIITAFGYKALTYEDQLAISLDMFLGDDYKFYPSLDFPEYQIQRMRKEYIVPEALRTYFMSLYEEKTQVDETMLSNMIYAGKQLYFLDVVAPDLPDTLKTGYTKEQLKWAYDNQGETWHHLVSEDLIYTTDQFKIAKYLADAPYTVDDGVPAESSPRLGEFTGWQIVKAYMEENPDVTLKELFDEKDYRKILKGSRYKPKR